MWFIQLHLKCLIISLTSVVRDYALSSILVHSPALFTLLLTCARHRKVLCSQRATSTALQARDIYRITFTNTSRCGMSDRTTALYARKRESDQIVVAKNYTSLVIQLILFKMNAFRCLITPSRIDLSMRSILCNKTNFLAFGLCYIARCMT